jgi:hypothetical protein
MNLKNGMKKTHNNKLLMLIIIFTLLMILFISMFIYGVFIKDYFVMFGNILNIILYILLFIDIVC